MRNENCFTEIKKTAIVVVTMIIVLIGFVSCNVLKNTGKESAYENLEWNNIDFANEANLKGKVKTISWSYNTPCDTMQIKHWFNELGLIVKWENFSHEEIIWSGVGNSVSKEVHKKSMKGFNEFKFDNAGNLISGIFTIIEFKGWGDTARVIIKKLEFNKQKYVTKDERIGQEYSYLYNKVIDTSKITRYYKYDNLNNRIYDSAFYESNFGKKTFITVENYDKKGRIQLRKSIEYEVKNDLTHQSPDSEDKWSYSRNWKIAEFTRRNYNSSKRDTSFSKEKISKNKNGDVVKRILIDNRSKNTEIYNYEYEENNNWIVKKGERVRVNFIKGDTAKYNIVSIKKIEYY